MIKSTVMPTSWDDVGGAGSIAPDEPHGALVLSQTQEGQDAVARLLLHAPPQPVRVAAARPAVADRGADVGAAVGGPLDCGRGPARAALQSARAKTGGAGCAGRASRARVGRVAVEPPPNETVRLGPYSGATAGTAAGNPPARLHSAGRRRCRGHRLAGGWGWSNWATGAKPSARSPTAGSPGCRTAPTTNWPGCSRSARPANGRLRLIPAGLSPSARTWLEVEFAGQYELPRLWQSHLAGKLTGRLRIRISTDLPAAPPMTEGNVTLEDAAGKSLARWMHSGGHPVELYPSVSAVLPALEAGWPGYVRLDWRSKEPAVDRPVREAVEAIGKSDWTTAAGKLAELRKSRPRQPLLLLLSALCCQHDPRLGDREQMVAMLKDVARQGPGALTQAVIEDSFPSLRPAERYDVLLCQPAEGFDGGGSGLPGPRRRGGGPLGGGAGTRPRSPVLRQGRPAVRASLCRGGTAVAAGEGRRGGGDGQAMGSRRGAYPRAVGHDGRVAGQVRPRAGRRRAVPPSPGRQGPCRPGAVRIDLPAQPESTRGASGGKSSWTPPRPSRPVLPAAASAWRRFSPS